MSTLLDVVTTLTNRKAAEALLLGGVEAREGPRDMRGCDSKNSHGTRGCRAHVEALAGLPDALRPVSSLVEVPEISRDVPAKTLTEQGAAAHMSKLLDVVTTVTDRRVADALLLGGVEAPEGPRDMRGCDSKSSHGTRGCRAHAEASGCCSNIVTNRRAARCFAAIANANGPAEGPQKWSGSCKGRLLGGQQAAIVDF